MNMKKIILALLVVVMSQASFAVESKAKETVRSKVKENVTVQEIQKEISSGKDFTKNEKIMPQLAKMLSNALKDVVNYDQVKILGLIAVDPVAVLTEIGHISTQLKDTKTTPARKAQLIKQFELIMEASSHVDATARTEAEANKHKADLSNTLQLAENLSHMDFAAAQPMIKKVESLLKSKSLENAINEAGKGAGKNGKDITAKEVKEEC